MPQYDMPFTGTLVEQQATQGDQVQSDTALFVPRLWVEIICLDALVDESLLVSP
jgi:hypothetical protein